MKISYFDDYTAMSKRASQLFVKELKTTPELLVCAATGGSPKGLYKLLADRHAIEPALFDQLKIMKLDEWGGLPAGDPNSCHSYLQTRVLTPLHITPDRYIAFDSGASDPAAECDRVQKEIDRTGPIDCCILGLGINGHIGFNEPSSFLRDSCHTTELSAESAQHAMARSMAKPPSFGMTVGMKAILQSQKILLLITGGQKQDAIERLLTGEITTQLPASFLWLHADTECLIDKTSCQTQA